MKLKKTFKIGKTKFKGQSPAKTIYVENQSKNLQKYNHFNNVPISFPAQEEYDKLSDNTKKILKILEIRSYKNNGDTKMKDLAICKLLNISQSTVKRSLRTLEKLGYIRRLTLKTTNNKTQNWKSVRYIRCCRVFLEAKCQVIYNLGWKTDLRPKFKQPEHITPEYIVEEPTLIRQKLYKPKFPRHPLTGWRTIPAHMFDESIVDDYYKYNDIRHAYENKRGENNLGIDILGYHKERKPPEAPHEFNSPADMVYNYSVTFGMEGF